MIFKYFILFASFLTGLSLLGMEQPSKGTKRSYFDLNNPDIEFSYTEYPDTVKVQAHSSDQDFPESQLIKFSVQPMSDERDKASDAENSTLPPLPFLNQPIETASQGLNLTARIKQKKCAICDLVVLNLNLHEKTGTHKKNIKRLMRETKKLVAKISWKKISQEFVSQSDYTDTDSDTEVYNPIQIPWDQIADKTSHDTFDGAHFLNTLYSITKHYRKSVEALEQTSKPIDQDFEQCSKNGSGKLYTRKSGSNNVRKYTFSIIRKKPNREQSKPYQSLGYSMGHGTSECPFCQKRFNSKGLDYHIETSHKS